MTKNKVRLLSTFLEDFPNILGWSSSSDLPALSKERWSTLSVILIDPSPV